MQQGTHKLVPIDEIILDKSNPRIALWLEMYEGEPTPEQIHQALGAGVDDKEAQGGTKFSTLKNSIQTNGGIIQPVIINTLPNGRMVCIEANTRVCLYKSFRDQKVTGSWDKIPAIVYKGLDDEAVDAIRLQAHLVGPRQWDPYSNTGTCGRPSSARTRRPEVNRARKQQVVSGRVAQSRALNRLAAPDSLLSTWLDRRVLDRHE